MVRFGARLPRLREAVDRDLDLEGMPRAKVLAATVHLLDAGFFRIGGEEYAVQNGSYGLLTLERRHARVEGESVVFEYPAKGGKERLQSVVDRRIREMVKGLKRRRTGSHLLAYQDDGWCEVRPEEVNDHIRSITGVDASAKDFRTWHATVLAAVGLAVSWPQVKSRTGGQKAMRRVVREVADYLGNTPAVCRRSYIDPRVIDLYLDGVTIRSALDGLAVSNEAPLATQGPAEQAVVRMLSRHGSGTQ